MFTYNTNDMSSIPHVVFEILFLKVCALSDVTVGPKLGGGDMAMGLKDGSSLMS